MPTISQAKIYGGVGSILVLLAFIPTVGWIISVIGFILTLLAVKYISDDLHDNTIFNNMIIAVALSILAFIVVGVIVAASVFGYIGIDRAVGTLCSGARRLDREFDNWTRDRMDFACRLLVFPAQDVQYDVSAIECRDVSHSSAHLFHWRHFDDHCHWTVTHPHCSDLIHHRVLLDTRQRGSWYWYATSTARISIDGNYNATARCSNEWYKVLRKVRRKPRSRC